MIGCSNYQKIVKKGTREQKLEAAKKYYNKKEYLKAQPLFEELLGLYYGQAEREEIYFFYAYSHYGVGEYLLAGYHFRNFTQTYALSSRREEAAYMTAVCDYQKSMPYELDQTATKSSINSLQSFINQYPNSSYVADCNSKIDDLRSRILVKVYNGAKLYYELGHYKSAIVACTNALDDYPDMINRDELSYLIAESSFLYAKNSIKKMQEERYESALSAISDYTSEFRSSGKYTKEIEKLRDKTKQGLEEARDININTTINSTQK